MADKETDALAGVDMKELENAAPWHHRDFLRLIRDRDFDTLRRKLMKLRGIADLTPQTKGALGESAEATSKRFKLTEADEIEQALVSNVASATTSRERVAPSEPERFDLLGRAVQWGNKLFDTTTVSASSLKHVKEAEEEATEQLKAFRMKRAAE